MHLRQPLAVSGAHAPGAVFFFAGASRATFRRCFVGHQSGRRGRAARIRSSGHRRSSPYPLGGSRDCNRADSRVRGCIREWKVYNWLGLLVCAFTCCVLHPSAVRAGPVPANAPDGNIFFAADEVAGQRARLPATAPPAGASNLMVPFFPRSVQGGGHLPAADVPRATSYG